MFQFMDGKQFNYCVINYLNLALGWWNEAGAIFSMLFWKSMNGNSWGKV